MSELFPEEKSLKILNAKVEKFPDHVLVLGSGWNKVLDKAEVEQEIGYKELFGVEATVPGHEGKLVIAKIGKTRIACMRGRLHTYEGYTSREVTLPIRVFAAAGAKELFLTAASGALNKNYRVGDFVILNDLLTLFLSLDNPLIGPQFLDMSACFDKKARESLVRIAKNNKIPFQEGSYCYYHGPNYETPTDKRALATLGADVVGMSTVPETLMARWLKMKVVAVAFVTNLAFVKHDHKEVLAEAEKGAGRMVELSERFYNSVNR